MGILDYFRSSSKEKHTASRAKERLQIIVAHQRAHRPEVDFLPKLKEEILKVICKYVEISDDQIQIHMDTNDKNCPVLELNVSLPEKQRQV
ncbi:MAG: cell division topological specificity factor MinE [Flavobacteriaceae bacterium]